MIPSQILTIISTDRRLQVPDDDVTTPTGDAQTNAILSVLAQRTDQTNHLVRRASSVQDVRAILTSTAVVTLQPQLIQILGHGDAGKLVVALLACNEYDDDRGLAFVLTSDQTTYKALAGVHLPATTVVLLLGCSVGAEGASDVDDGPSLLFGIARMWGCQVAAPVDMTEARDHDSEGVFNGYSNLVGTPGGPLGTRDAYLARLSSVQAPTGGVYQFKRGVAAPTHLQPTTTILQLQRLLSTLPLGLNRALSALDDGVHIPPSLSLPLEQRIGNNLFEIPTFAAPSAVFACQVFDPAALAGGPLGGGLPLPPHLPPGRPGFAEVIANGTLLRCTVFNGTAIALRWVCEIKSPTAFGGELSALRRRPLTIS